MKSQFKAGVAAFVITPPLGTPLYGYEFQRKATKVNDDLRATALAFEQDDLKGVMISADVVSIGADLAKKLRTLICNETGVPFENITISATHTHSGPALKSANGWGNANEEYISNIFIPQVAAAAKAAVNELNLLRLAQIEKTSLHTLRHTCASKLYELSNGDTQFVSEMLRHESASFTAKVYIHLERKYKSKRINNFAI